MQIIDAVLSYRKVVLNMVDEPGQDFWTVISWKYAHGRWASSKRGVSVFLRVVIFLSKICPPHTQSRPIVMYPCSDSAMPLLSCACLSTLCLPSFTSPSSCTVCCFLLNITTCTMADWIGKWVWIQEKSTLCNNFIQKRGLGLLLRFLGDYSIRANNGVLVIIYKIYYSY